MIRLSINAIDAAYAQNLIPVAVSVALETPLLCSCTSFSSLYTRLSIAYTPKGFRQSTTFQGCAQLNRCDLVDRQMERPIWNSTVVLLVSTIGRLFLDRW